MFIYHYSYEIVSDTTIWIHAIRNLWKLKLSGDRFCMLHVCLQVVFIFFLIQESLFSHFLSLKWSTVRFFLFYLVFTSLLPCFFPDWRLKLLKFEIWPQSSLTTDGHPLCVCVALNYQTVSIFPIVYGDFVGEEYSLVHNCSLNTWLCWHEFCSYWQNVGFLPLMPKSASFHFLSLCKVAKCAVG